MIYKYKCVLFELVRDYGSRSLRDENGKRHIERTRTPILSFRCAAFAYLRYLHQVWVGRKLLKLNYRVSHQELSEKLF